MQHTRQAPCIHHCSSTHFAADSERKLERQGDNKAGMKGGGMGERKEGGMERGKLGQRRGKYKGKATRGGRETGGGEGKILEGNTIIALNTSRTAQVLGRNSHLIPDGRLLVKRHRLLLLVALLVIVLALLLLVLLFLLVLLVILLVLVLCGM